MLSITSLPGDLLERVAGLADGDTLVVGDVVLAEQSRQSGEQAEFQLVLPLLDVISAVDGAGLLSNSLASAERRSERRRLGLGPA